MVDTPGDEPSAPEEGAGEAGAKLTSVPISINAQYIKDLSFENPRAPNSLMLTKEQPKVDVDVNVNARKLQDDAYEVALTIRVDTKVAGDTAFLSELVYGGLFTIKDVPEKALRPLLLIECPRLLFPFARRVIADVTRDGGFPPLLVNPIDFAELYRRQFTLEEEPPAGEA
jgi:preprotein translocase subunit SecB